MHELPVGVESHVPYTGRYCHLVKDKRKLSNYRMHSHEFIPTETGICMYIGGRIPAHLLPLNIVDNCRSERP